MCSQMGTGERETTLNFKVNTFFDLTGALALTSLQIKLSLLQQEAAVSTTNLIRHLKNKHPAEYGCTKSTLEDRREKFPRDSYKAKKITERVIEFISLDDQPIAEVENAGFRCLFEPRYALPS